MKTADILAIGTEITTGEIVNRNAAWIAERLVDLGFLIGKQIAVPDDEKLMRWALESSSESDLVIVTGGLGPTTDDFTREVVASWLGEELVFDESCWQRIENRFKELDIPIVQSNRRQCMFPSSAQIIENPVGTANAFRMQKGSAIIYCLPGPPREISAIWERSLTSELKELDSDEELLLKKWSCLGVSESQLGEWVEETLKGSGLTTGYRTTVPYVEVKVWVSQNELLGKRPYLDRLEEQLSPWVVTRDNEDLVDLLLQSLPTDKPIILEDDVTRGYLAERFSANKAAAGKDIKGAVTLDESWLRRDNQQRSHSPDKIILQAFPEAEWGHWQVRLVNGGKTHSEILTLPGRFLKDPTQRFRARKFVGERCLQWWHQNI